ncbi:MAG: bifunctional phosphoglucose/phosphomannose isomerase [Armatimonadetes bacterium]|nr:bifunctional phosphoglucose/phosphomannose isomerase [Armatimonadota bacterium]NIM23002.1 bifunctional phosphoglucose/phosphomannose isomerase [Armatimonadota bacterium]NIM66873.1 bifunctional phosphoglucose/phosphomannose isomerase [Armatimonadota bacterium]NIM75413.1 bifunctional phosphoglucose/phosphomannose isomerase [Armatimonadota bacterium]NIN05060.1 bifunctional phosphoglucose/phosphomannose isomerase [Armatimonadota bacterium]
MASRDVSRPIDLNKPESYLSLDPAGMLAMTADFPGQCREAVSIGEGFSAPTSFSKAQNILLCGLGGSAIAGDLVHRLTADRITVPFQVNRQYEIPSWVKENTLVILSSYSGNTEETLSAFQDTLSRKAQAVCITSGGKLAQLAGDNDVPVISIPSGRPPRASTGFLIFPVLSILEKSGFIPSLEKEKAETVAVLEAMSRELDSKKPVAENEAKKIALWLQDKFSLIYGWGYLAPAAYRWQTQLHENSKALAHSGELPEMNHNEVVAWAHKGALAGKLAVVLLRCEDEPPRIRARFELTKRIISDHASLREYQSRGEARLSRQMSLVYLGDYASIYLALLSGKDPVEINAINFLKGELAKLPQ